MVAAFVLLAAIIGGVFAGSGLYIFMDIENRLIDQRLAHVAELWRSGRETAEQVKASELGLYVDQEMPEAFQTLKPGRHELRVDGRALHVWIGTDDGHRYAITDDQSDFEALEGYSLIALGSAFLGGIVLALLIGRASASRVILPLTQLASAVQDEPQEAALPGLDASDEIGVLARAIEDRTNQLCRALQRERWFTADVSHELQTPLEIMLGAAEVLGRRLKDDPKLLAMSERIRHNAADSTQQINALLQLAQVPESVHFVRVPLRPLIEHEMGHWQPLLLEKSLAIELSSAEDVSVLAIPELVTIAFNHLLRKASMHSEKGVICIRLNAGEIAIDYSGAGPTRAIAQNWSHRVMHDHDCSCNGPDLSVPIAKRVADHLGWTLTEGANRFVLKFAPIGKSSAGLAGSDVA